MGKGLAKAVEGGSVLLASRNAHDCSHGDAGSRGDDGDGEGVDERGNSGGREGFEAAAGRRIVRAAPPHQEDNAAVAAVAAADHGDHGDHEEKDTTSPPFRRHVVLHENDLPAPVVSGPSEDRGRVIVSAMPRLPFFAPSLFASCPRRKEEKGMVVVAMKKVMKTIICLHQSNQ